MYFDFETLIPSSAVAGQINAMAKTAKHEPAEAKAGRFVIKKTETSPKRRKSLVDLTESEREIVSHNVRHLRGSMSRPAFASAAKIGAKTVERLENKLLPSVEGKSLMRIAEYAYIDVDSLKSIKIEASSEQPIRLLREILSMDPQSPLAKQIIEEHKRLTAAKR